MIKKISIFLSLLLLLTCAKEDSQDPGTTPSNITPRYTLTASAGEGGSVSPTTGNFNAGTQVRTLTLPLHQVRLMDGVVSRIMIATCLVS